MAYSGGPMTEAMYYVLLALTHPGHGYQLMNEIGEISHGRLHIGPGTLYGLLAKMLDDGMILIIEDDGRRKVYGISEEGSRALGEEFARLQAAVADSAALVDHAEIYEKGTAPQKARRIAHTPV